MLIIEDTVKKTLKKHLVPKHIYVNIYNALTTVDEIKNVDLFDITDMQDQYQKYKYHYYRIKKGNYRGIFYFDGDNTHLYAMGKRETVYDTKLI